MDTPAIAAEDLHKPYGKVVALDRDRLLGVLGLGDRPARAQRLG